MQSIILKNRILVSKTNEGGLGDILLSIVGLTVLCEFIEHKLVVIFNSRLCTYPWGSNEYDLRLLNIEGVEIIENNKYENTMHRSLEIGCSTDVSPYLLHKFVSRSLNLDLETVSKKYIELAQKIKPSFIIISDIPSDIVGSYGIHLRKSDKVSNSPFLFHENTHSEFEFIVTQMVYDLTQIIINESDPKFIIVSEDKDWLVEFIEILKTVSSKYCKNINIVKIRYDDTKINNYKGYKSVLDMFCLSKCKKIFQSVKVSTFSTISALIGNVPIINYSHLLNNYHESFIHIWSSVVTINNNICYDLQKFEKFFENKNNMLTRFLNIKFKNCNYNF